MLDRFVCLLLLIDMTFEFIRMLSDHPAPTPAKVENYVHRVTTLIDLLVMGYVVWRLA
jgi:hypothetical protein